VKNPTHDKVCKRTIKYNKIGVFAFLTVAKVLSIFIFYVMVSKVNAVMSGMLITINSISLALSSANNRRYR